MEKENTSIKVRVGIYMLTSVIWYFLITHLNISTPQVSALNFPLYLSSKVFIYVGINTTLSKIYVSFLKINKCSRMRRR